MLGQTDLSAMSIGNLMCLIAAYAKIRFFWVQLSDSGNTMSDFSNIPRHSTTIRHTLGQNSQNRMSPLIMAYLMFIQVFASPPKTARPKPWPSGWRRCKQSSKNNGPQVAWAWMAPAIMQPPSISGLMCFFLRWLCYVLFDAGKSCLQSLISCLKTGFHQEGNHTKTCSGLTDIHFDKITDPACRGRHHASDDARELRGNFGSNNTHVDWSWKCLWVLFSVAPWQEKWLLALWKATARHAFCNHLCNMDVLSN